MKKQLFIYPLIAGLSLIVSACGSDRTERTTTYVETENPNTPETTLESNTVRDQYGNQTVTKSTTQSYTKPTVRKSTVTKTVVED